jgi:dTMP kinase
MFISFEGPDCIGKTTQIASVVESLKLKFISVTETREPGGTEFGDIVRNYIKNIVSMTVNSGSYYDQESSINLHADDYNLNTERITLMILAARSNHICDLILPNLKSNHVVLCDRYHESTLVYQCMTNQHAINYEFSSSILNLINVASHNFIMPNITFVFLMEFDLLAERIQKSNRFLDKIESNGVEFTKVIWSRYIALMNFYKNIGHQIEILSDRKEFYTLFDFADIRGDEQMTRSFQNDKSRDLDCKRHNFILNDKFNLGLVYCVNSQVLKRGLKRKFIILDASKSRRHLTNDIISVIAREMA